MLIQTWICNHSNVWDAISYLLFAGGDTWIFTHLASQYHARPKAMRAIAMLSLNEFLYLQKQTKGN